LLAGSAELERVRLAWSGWLVGIYLWQQIGAIIFKLLLPFPSLCCRPACFFRATTLLSPCLAAKNTPLSSTEQVFFFDAGGGGDMEAMIGYRK
jgi:hypothetical protein